jgi:hypothetical protein
VGAATRQQLLLLCIQPQVAPFLITTAASIVKHDRFEHGGHVTEEILAPLKLLERVGDLQTLTIPAKFAFIGGRQLELLVPPARAAALQRLPRACCARAHTALPHCFGECAPFQKFKVKKPRAGTGGTPFPFFFFQLGVWLVLFGSSFGGGPLRAAIEKNSKIYQNL